MNQRPPGDEPDELQSCATPRPVEGVCWLLYRDHLSQGVAWVQALPFGYGGAARWRDEALHRQNGRLGCLLPGASGTTSGACPSERLTGHAGESPVCLRVGVDYNPREGRFFEDRTGNEEHGITPRIGYSKAESSAVRRSPSPAGDMGVRSLSRGELRAAHRQRGGGRDPCASNPPPGTGRESEQGAGKRSVRLVAALGLLMKTRWQGADFDWVICCERIFALSA